MSENTSDFKIDLGGLPTPNGEVKIDLGPLGEENEPCEEIALVDEPEKDEPKQPEANDVTTTTVAGLHREPKSKFGEWYVIHTCSGIENRVKQNLNSRATSLNMEGYIFETIVPTEEAIEVRNDTRKTITRRILPGYMLVRMELTDDSWATVRHTPSVIGFADHDQTPIPLSPDEMVSMLTLFVVAEVASKALTTVARAKKKVEVAGFAVGDSVIVIDGPFARAYTTITKISTNQQRFRALVEILDRETPVGLELKQVEKVG